MLLPSIRIRNHMFYDSDCIILGPCELQMEYPAASATKRNGIMVRLLTWRGGATSITGTPFVMSEVLSICIQTEFVLSVIRMLLSALFQFK